MSFDEGFVEEVRLNPKDDNARLILADYLEESGDPRGEFIRIQIELAGLEPMDKKRRALEVRESELLEDHGEHWLEQLRNLGAEGVSVRCFERGMVERIKISAENFLANGAELCRIAPAFHCLQLQKMTEHIPALIAYTMPQQITSLDISSQRLGTTFEGPSPPGGEIQFTLLCQSPWFGQLSELNLTSNRLSDIALSSFSFCDLSKLNILQLSGNRLSGESISNLITNQQNKLQSSLQSLSLGLNQLKTGDHRIQFELLTNLRSLDMASSDHDDELFAKNFSAGSFDTLESLVLRGNDLTAKTAELLCSPGKFENLKHLDIRNTTIATNQTKEKFGDGLIV